MAGFYESGHTMRQTRHLKRFTPAEIQEAKEYYRKEAEKEPRGDMRMHALEALVHFDRYQDGEIVSSDFNFRQNLIRVEMKIENYLILKAKDRLWRDLELEYLSVGWLRL